MVEGKDKALETALAEINKTWGKNSIVKVGETEIEAVPSMATGIPEVDKVFGCGGIPRGRIIEIFGGEGGGKTTMTLLCIASVQKQKGKCVYIDVENSFDKRWAASLGVDVDNLFLVQPDTAESVFDIIEKLINSSGVDLIVVDSAAALVTAAELEEDYSKTSQPGQQARLLGRGLKRINNLLGKSKTSAIIFINQIRYKIGVMFGNPETTPGGMALRFYSSLRLRVSKVYKSEIYNNDKVVIGHKVDLKVIKNKVGPILGEATLEIKYGKEKNEELKNEQEIKQEDINNEEILDAEQIVDKALSLEILKKNGAYFTYKEKTIYLSKKKLIEKEDLIQRLKEDLKEGGEK